MAADILSSGELATQQAPLFLAIPISSGRGRDDHH